MQADWEDDSGGQSVLWRERFYDALFELADLWTSTCAGSTLDAPLVALAFTCGISEDGRRLRVGANPPSASVSCSSCSTTSPPVDQGNGGCAPTRTSPRVARCKRTRASLKTRRMRPLIAIVPPALMSTSRDDPLLRMVWYRRFRAPRNQGHPQIGPQAPLTWRLMRGRGWPGRKPNPKRRSLSRAQCGNPKRQSLSGAQCPKRRSLSRARFCSGRFLSNVFLPPALSRTSLWHLTSLMVAALRGLSAAVAALPPPLPAAPRLAAPQQHRACRAWQQDRPRLASATRSP